MAVKKAAKSKKVASKKKIAGPKKVAKAKKGAKSAKASKLVKSMPMSKGPVNKSFSKVELLTNIANSVGLSKKEVGNVLEAFVNTIERHIKKGAVGSFVFPGVLKLVVVRKPATKARQGINPFTGESTIFKAKPARNVVKIKALKKIKDMV